VASFIPDTSQVYIQIYDVAFAGDLDARGLGRVTKANGQHDLGLLSLSALYYPRPLPFTLGQPGPSIGDAQIRRINDNLFACLVAVDLGGFGTAPWDIWFLLMDGQGNISKSKFIGTFQNNPNNVEWPDIFAVDPSDPANPRLAYLATYPPGTIFNDTQATTITTPVTVTAYPGGDLTGGGTQITTGDNAIVKGPMTGLAFRDKLNFYGGALRIFTKVGPGVFWGVDSLEVVDQTFFDAVTAQAVGAGGTSPSFWGRYIGSAEGNLSQPEVDNVLHKNNCKVLLIYNGTYDTYDGKKHVATYADGVFHANNAIEYIKKKPLAVPQNKSVWIYLDTEFGNGFPKLPAELFRGWFDAMLGSPYGGAGGVYGNTIDDAEHNPFFNTPFCSAYNSGISFIQRDTPASCQLKQYFGNPVGGNADKSSGREATAGWVGGTPGVTRLIETMNASESEAIYVLWEITPGPNAVWRAGNWTIRLNVTVPSHFITWNGVEIVHTDQHCNGIERLGNLDGQSVSLIPPGVQSMVVPGIAPASAPAAGDKVLLLLSFSNSKAESRSFGYTPDQLIDSPFGRVGVLVYANEPEPIDQTCKPGYRTFGPYQPKPCNAPTVIQQYTIKCAVTGTGTPPKEVDYDLANAAGFASMW